MRLNRRLGTLAGAALLLAGALTACGDSSSSSSAPKPAPAVSTAAPSPTAAVCSDVKQVKQSVSDLQAAVSGKDLPAGQSAWAALGTAVTSLGTTAKDTGSAAAQSLHDLLAPIVSNFSDLDTIGKLTAIVGALALIGPALTSALGVATDNFDCPL